MCILFTPLFPLLCIPLFPFFCPLPACAFCLSDFLLKFFQVLPYYYYYFESPSPIQVQSSPLLLLSLYLGPPVRALSEVRCERAVQRGS